MKEATLFLNISNHPLAAWAPRQAKSAVKLTVNRCKKTGGVCVGEWAEGDDHMDCDTGIIQECQYMKGRLEDMAVDPRLSEDGMDALVTEWFQEVLAKAVKHYREQGSLGTVVVHLMGETGFSTRLAVKLHNFGIRVVHSTTARTTRIRSDGTKESVFSFVRFRDTL
jgi:hypothetical protein